MTVARRRSHAQTTSLHAVSALLALPSSTLRDACARARSSSYSPRLQFRALELCVGVSLDRQPTSKSVDEPPISNSLMAAIKRSQANQRRHPETFHLYQQMQQQLQSQTSSLSCVKVELKHFILSILDDPIVSRVFGDAGFRSSDIKLAILQPPTISGFPRSRCPPVFLCSLPDPDPNLNFPFGGSSGDENSRRIGEILVKKKGRNPLLIGVSAGDALNRFTETINSCKGGILPDEINGISMICIEKEIHDFVAGNWSENMMALRFEEVREAVEGCTGGGIVVNYGVLKVFVEGGSGDAVDYVIAQLGSLVKVYGEKLWLIGAVGSYETYMKFSTRFPAIEKEWDMNLLPITSSKSCIGGSPSKTSLMGSFVPFGGFFPSPSELENLSSSTNLSVVRCDLCNEKYEQEVSVILKGGSTVSIANQHSASLASWLTPEPDTSKRMNAIEAKDHGSVLSVRLVGVQKKWNDICQRIHHNQSFQQGISQVRSNVPGIDSSLNESRFSTLGPSIPGNFQKILQPRQNAQLAICSEAKDASPSQQKSPVDYFAHKNTSSLSTASVTTDLGLGTIYACAEKDQGQGKVKLQGHEDRLQNISESVSAEVDGISKSHSYQMAKSSPCSHPELVGHSGEKDFKQLCRVLAESVGWQHEAIYTISQTISRCRSGNGKRRGSSHRGDIWLTFLGPDKMGKRKIAAALAEIIFGSKESLISVDLNSEIGFEDSNSIFDCQHSNLYDVKTRGKTVVDYIAQELSRKPRSVVLLENVDKADFLSQNSLSWAIRTGKFQNTHGREISTSGMIFVTTSSTEVEENSFAEEVLYTEETVLGAKGLQMHITVESVAMDVTRTNSSNVLLIPKKATSNPASVKKRKLTETNEFEIWMPAIKVSRSCFDLNLPVEEAEGGDDCATSDNDSSSEPKEVWLEDFLDGVDEKVVFKPFEFDALAENILKEIGRSFQKTVGNDVVLEIGKEVLVQILASSWLSDKKSAIEDWFATVLYRGFMEAKQKHCINAQSVVKLLTVEGGVMEEQAPNVCLPERIILN